MRYKRRRNIQKRRITREIYDEKIVWIVR